MRLEAGQHSAMLFAVDAPPDGSEPRAASAGNPIGPRPEE
jgi:hypothetical protein